ncbi:MAG: response regulator, partial [Deltaproteobacteria bacterium]|nr:response regulator [Deltaproteobacteria bacterium]
MQNTVLLVDDHPVFRKGLLSLLEDEEDMLVIGEAGDGHTALELVKELSPDIVVMDVTMPGLSGIETTERIVAKFPDTKVVALSIHSEKQFVLDMLQAGAAGYILKESVPEELIKGIRSVMLGEGYLSPAITGVVVSQFRNSMSREDPFTESTLELLETKLHTPKLSEYHVHRSRLLNSLEQNRQLSLQTITAPAGYGKSTLAGCWLTSHGWPHAWLSLDENDNDLRQFISYLLFAIETLFPRALPQSTALLASSNLPPVPLFAATLINEIELIGQDFILVLDDFHLVKEKEVYDLLTELLRHPPAPLHLVVLSRTDLFLPLTRLRSQGLLSEFRMKDLQFTTGETGEFLGYKLHQAIDESLAGDWCKKTEGWITGLRLATQTIKNRSELSDLLSNLQGTGQYVMEYLFNEVLADQPENIRKHLITVSIVDKFNASLIEVLCPYAGQECASDGWSIISWINKHNLYIIPLDNENRWFRFHHLFLELLQKQLQRNYSPTEIAEFHSRASDWFEGQGLIDEAIRHALLAEDMVGAVEIFERYRRDESDDHCLNITRWHNLFPEDLKKDQPGLLLAQAWFLHEQYRLLDIIPILHRVESLFKDKPPDDISRGELKLFQGILLYWEGKGKLSLKLLRQALEVIPQKHTILCGLAEVYVSVASHLTGQGKMNCLRLNNRLREGVHLDGLFLSRLILGQSLHYMLSAELTKVMQDARSVEFLSGHRGLTLPQHWGDYLLAAYHFL